MAVYFHARRRLISDVYLLVSLLNPSEAQQVVQSDGLLDQLRSPEIRVRFLRNSPCTSHVVSYPVHD